MLPSPRLDQSWQPFQAQVVLSSPTLAWEIKGYEVNEAPAALVKNGKIFITYSASATDQNYCMGLLTADAGADLLDPKSWTKAAQPILQSSQYGPGHNAFTTTPDGRIDILVYHARNYRQRSSGPAGGRPETAAAASWASTGSRSASSSLISRASGNRRTSRRRARKRRMRTRATCKTSPTSSVFSLGKARKVGIPSGALKRIGELGEGLALYLRQEGRGFGLLNKRRAYSLQDSGLDTVEANLALGFRDDERDCAIAAHMLRSLDVRSVRVMTNNPRCLLPCPWQRTRRA